MAELRGPLLSTKLFVPRTRPDVVARPRVMALVSQALSVPLTLVSASAGFGKTTALCQWIELLRDKAPVAWVSLDPGDNDPTRFWDYCITALEKIKPFSGDTSLAILHSDRPYPLETLLTSLINELAAMSGDLAIVLDDYHSISNQAIHAGIAFLLDHAPPNLHLIISSRIDPLFSLAKLRSRGLMAEVGTEDLRFTRGEASALLKEQSYDLSPRDVDLLSARTEGWAVGLKMALLSLRSQKDPDSFLAAFAGSHRYVMDYLVDEVLGNMLADVREFLIQTSILGRLNGDLCDSVLQRSGSTGVLERLDLDLGGFVVPMDQGRRWHRYHHLLADVLRHRLELSHGALHIGELHRRASIWYEANGFLDESIGHALASRDWSHALDVIQRAAGDRAKRGEHQTVIGWLERVPEPELLQREPLYVLYARVLILAGPLVAAEHALEKMARFPICSPGEVAALQADLARRKGDLAQERKLAAKALSLLPEDNLLYRGRASHILGIASNDEGRFDDALKLLSDAAEMATRANDSWVAADSLTYKGIACAKMGRLSEAAIFSRRAADIAGRSPAAALALEELGYLAYERNALEEAAVTLQAGADAAELTGSEAVRLGCYVWLALTRVAQGDLAAARLAAERSVSPRVDTMRPAARAWHASWRIKLSLRLRDLEAAAHWYSVASEPPGILPFSYRHIPVRFLIARGELDEATRQLAQLRELALHANALGLVIEIGVYQSLSSPEPEAARFLAETLQLAEPRGFIRTFVDEGEFLINKLRAALAQGVCAEYTTKLLSAIATDLRTRQPHGKTMPLPDSPDLVSPRELEALRLAAEGLSNQEIAERLVVSLNTARTHLYHAFDKLGAKTRTEAIARARTLKLI